jgi:hypothetical protein
MDAMEFTDHSDVRFKEVEDTINFQLRFPSGALAQCTSSYAMPDRITFESSVLKAGPNSILRPVTDCTCA